MPRMPVQEGPKTGLTHEEEVPHLHPVVLERDARQEEAEEVENRQPHQPGLGPVRPLRTERKEIRPRQEKEGPQAAGASSLPAPAPKRQPISVTDRAHQPAPCKPAREGRSGHPSRTHGGRCLLPSPRASSQLGPGSLLTANMVDSPGGLLSGSSMAAAAPAEVSREVSRRPLGVFSRDFGGRWFPADGR